MPKKRSVSKLPESDRRERLVNFLTVLGQDRGLEHFRTIVRTAPERQLALFAALEREVIVGPPAAAPPRHDDEADQLLCDILDVIDSHPDTRDHRLAYFGPDRHLANLQALGLWRGDSPIEQPSARELFTTTFSSLTADSQSTSPTSETINSPAPQDFASGGELIAAETSHSVAADKVSQRSQTVDGVLVVSLRPDQVAVSKSPNPSEIIHHADPNPGEKSGPTVPVGLAPVGWAVPANSPDSSGLPHRPVRRGRPMKLDDLAKGRLLGLMSYGLSFRQAAAQLGVHHVTLLNALKRDDEFAQQVSEARLDAVSQPLLTVIQASRTSWRAAAWLAKFLEDRRISIYETTPEERELAERTP
jgi:hypothetical protein